MADSERHLDWEGCYNVRDLGGLPLAEGGQTRRGALVRADLLGRLTPRGKEQLRDYGVRTVIDLRFADERLEHPPLDFAGEDGTPLVLPVPAGRQDPSLRPLFAAAETRAELYAAALDHFGAEHAAVLRAVVNAAEDGAVAYHCHSGKDRTALISALLLSLAGATEEAIAADYAASQERLWPLYESWLAEGNDDADDPWLKPICAPQTMRDTLAYLQERYGGAEGYLLEAGLTGREIGRLRGLLLP